MPLLAFGAAPGHIPPPPGVGGVSQVVGNVPKPVKVDFSGISLAQAVAVVYSEILRQPYVIDPAVLKDDRAVSFRFDAAKGDIKRFWRDFLDQMGMAVTVRGGGDFIALKRVVDQKDAEPDREPFIYRTKHRAVAYLVEMLSPLFKAGGFGLTRSVRASAGGAVNIGGAGTAMSIPATSAAALIDQDADTLIFNGTAKEIATLERLLKQVDVAAGEVVIKAVVVEVTTGKTDGTAFSLVAHVLGGRLGVSVGSGSALTNSVTFRAANIEAAVTALAADSRFKAVSTPRVRVKSGQQARLVVGQDVPTLGAVTIPQGGSQAVQSVDYRSSGVILGLSPTVRDEGVELLVDQQISDFARPPVSG
ncbi:type II secretory pathway protein [Rugamonas sp. CCM 8940]|uniref:type II secretory pathway protein n=1 Tax=Rugamonas sp. CCM 8940 TaxID=2765359 RepID=UPI0018F3E54E|nr:type II secretory pathway protein [Rugamonas sp. CCM 8940]MBJ7314363.1 type II secretory pathway protein [Rugamonas sp. CCM 8940]